LHPDTEVVAVNDARTLERELAATLARVTELEAELKDTNEHADDDASNAQFHRKQYMELQNHVRELETQAEAAWGVIANAGNPQGDWESLPAEWQKYAARWRDRYFNRTGEAAQPPAPQYLDSNQTQQ
jgi:hypothetical protein